ERDLELGDPRLERLRPARAGLEPLLEERPPLSLVEERALVLLGDVREPPPLAVEVLVGLPQLLILDLERLRARGLGRRRGLVGLVGLLAGLDRGETLGLSFRLLLGGGGL